jgi:hypothetical protein
MRIQNAGGQRGSPRGFCEHVYDGVVMVATLRGVIGGAWPSVHLAGVWSQAVGFMLVRLAGILLRLS